jgi:hypothetical protein
MLIAPDHVHKKNVIIQFTAIMNLHTKILELIEVLAFEYHTQKSQLHNFNYLRYLLAFLKS